MAAREPFLAACVQMRAGLSRRRNVEDACALIAEAAGRGARLIATPEMTNVLDRDPDRMFADLPEEKDLEEIETFAEAARRHGAWLLIGSMAVRIGARRAANRGFLYAPDGSIAARYDKIHMFDVQLSDGETWRESNVYAPGEEAVVVETPLAVFGLTICYDVRFARLYRTLAQAGAQVLCVPAAFTRQTGEAHWHALLRARAIENGAFVVAPAQGGKHEDGRATFGHSLIVDPWGKILAEAEGDAPGVILGEIDPQKSREARERIPNLGLERAMKLRTIRHGEPI
ncbi:carbon-nitrogen hydrolase family protein [Amphiplicatus metriothermophilus]|uniref:Predicted amidohydrolase n=1 Tax=Amphiplicatus metriothermophilus TaxID=1519374 RepID=A0A239PTH1_9PROT|nr:carbon-nitrogen hydrolase family protein [Amphiplicatus metriothermophilus]MBB5519136.1 putative amidohydrolase [Amphiplicatus metriothermophilus]SNT73206.1 Predicted amidohydrolase [Amphiplicatus metriothermophilus]